MDIKQLYDLYRRCGKVTTDSRDCPSGSIFFALKGASFDGNKFAHAALEKGCSYAVIDAPAYHDPSDPRLILVSDSLTTFKELAREHRRQFKIPVIGITGTNGKTTTKELVSAVLAKRYRVLHTEGNFNNDVGVPKTLLHLTRHSDIAVVEMGASHPGDIRKLVEYVEPTYGIITNVGRAHLAGFGSFEGVMRTKGELYDYLAAHKGHTYINMANPHLVQMAKERGILEQHPYGYGQSNEACKYFITGRVAGCDPYVRLRYEFIGYQNGREDQKQLFQYEVQTKLIGAYNADNLLAAITVGLTFGLSAEEANEALEAYTPTNDRSELEHTTDNTLIMDAYNANPSSMAAALDNFARITTNQPKMAILGDMRELGEASGEEHQRVVDTLKGMGLDQVWLVGEEFGKTQCGFRKFHDVEEVKAAITQDKPRGRCILIKGSNGVKLYQLPTLL